jgi:hypothetical protein
MTRGSGGGGYHSRPHVEKSVRTGSGSKSARPAGVSQLGNKQGSHSTNVRDDSDYRGERLHNDRTFQPVKFGKELALNVGKGGPGTGRTVMSCGSQGQHGDVAGARLPKGRDILSNE